MYVFQFVHLISNEISIYRYVVIYILISKYRYVNKILHEISICCYNGIKEYILRRRCVVVELYIKLKEVLVERGITQKQLAEQSGIRANAISEMVNNQRQTINKDQLAKVCEVLGIERVEDMLEFRK